MNNLHSIVKKLDLERFCAEFLGFFARENVAESSINFAQSSAQSTAESSLQAPRTPFAKQKIDELSTIIFTPPPRVKHLNNELLALKKGGVLRLDFIFEFVKIIKYFLYLKNLNTQNLPYLRENFEVIKIPHELLKLAQVFENDGTLRAGQNLNEKEGEIWKKFDALNIALKSANTELKRQLNRLLSNPKLAPYLVDKSAHFIDGKEALLLSAGFGKILQGRIIQRTQAGFFYIVPDNLQNIYERIDKLRNEREIVLYEIEKMLSLAMARNLAFLKFINAEFDRFDALQARVRFAKERNLEFIAPSAKNEIILRDFYHPNLKNQVPCNVDFSAQILLITGVNAGGKTMLLKSILSASLLSNLLIPFKINPHKSQIPPFSAIEAIINDPQDSKNDISTFAGRMLEFSEILKQIDADSAGNSVLGMQFRTCENFGESTDSSLVLSPKFSQIQKPHRNHFDGCFASLANPADCDSLRKSTANQTQIAESTLDSANPTKNTESANKSQQTIEGIAVEVVGFLGDFGCETGLKSAKHSKSPKSPQDAPKSKLPQDDSAILLGIDEIELGTDANEASALYFALLEHLEHKNIKVIITTHHKILASKMADSARVELLAALYDEKNRAPTFEFLKGTIGKSYAFESALKYGIPRFIIQKAQKIYDENLENLNVLLEQSARLKADLSAKIALLDDESAKIARQKDELNALIDAQNAEFAEKKAKLEATYQNAVAELKRAIKQSDTRAMHRLLNAQHRDFKALPKESTKTNIDFKKGERVALGKSAGVILRIDGEKALLELENGVRVRAKISALKKAPQIPTHPQKVSVNKSAKSCAVCLDLHGKRVDEALDLLDSYISDCLIAGFSEVVIKHGIGSGVLSAVVRDFLSAHPKVAGFEDAPPNLGGFGAKIVKF